MLGRILFSSLLRCEHRQLLDDLLDLAFALGRGERGALQVQIARLLQTTGPRLRYAEESLYPTLLPLLGERGVERLLADHDDCIEILQRLSRLIQDEQAAPADWAEAMRLVRALARHVSACERLASLVLQLGDREVQLILAKREQAWDEDLNLLHWSAWLRRRESARVSAPEPFCDEERGRM